MNSNSFKQQFSVVAVSLLLILTVLGNAVVLFAASVIGLIVSILLFRKEVALGGALAAAVGMVTASIISLVLILK